MDCRMFNPGGEICENVHSQTRRMVMISPEPGFWIHAVSSALSYSFHLLTHVTSAWSCPRPLVSQSSLQAKARNRNLSSKNRCSTTTKGWFTILLSRHTCNERTNYLRYPLLSGLVPVPVFTDMNGIRSGTGPSPQSLTR